MTLNLPHQGTWVNTLVIQTGQLTPLAAIAPASLLPHVDISTFSSFWFLTKLYKPETDGEQGREAKDSG